jgi:polar amino acid transport system permease protein
MLDLTFTDILGRLLQGAIVTLTVSAGAWVVAVTLGLGFALLTESRIPVVVPVTNFVTTCLRALPQLVILYVVFFGLGGIGISLDPIVAAIVALGAMEGAFASEVYRAGLLTVSTVQREAGLSLGLNKFQLFRLVIVPQMIPFLIAPLLNVFVGLTKTATIASAVGVPEILYDGQALMNETFQIVLISGMIVALYVMFTVPLTRLAARFEARASFAH